MGDRVPCRHQRNRPSGDVDHDATRDTRNGLDIEQEDVRRAAEALADLDALHGSSLRPVATVRVPGHDDPCPDRRTGSDIQRRHTAVDESIGIELNRVPAVDEAPHPHRIVDPVDVDLLGTGHDVLVRESRDLPAPFHDDGRGLPPNPAPFGVDASDRPPQALRHTRRRRITGQDRSSDARHGLTGSRLTSGTEPPRRQARRRGHGDRDDGHDYQPSLHHTPREQPSDPVGQARGNICPPARRTRAAPNSGHLAPKWGVRRPEFTVRGGTLGQVRDDR